MGLAELKKNVPTLFYSEKAFNILKFCSKSYTANVIIDGHECNTTDDLYCSDHVLRGYFQRNDDNQIIFTISNIYNKPIQDTTKKIAYRYKECIFALFNLTGFDKKDETVHKCSYDLTFEPELYETSQKIKFETTIKELACVYDILNGSPLKTLIKTYGEDFVNATIGKPLNPFQIEQIKILKEEIDNLQNEETIAIENVRAKWEAKLTENKQKYFDLEEKLKKQMQEDIEKIENKYYDLIQQNSEN